MAPTSWTPASKSADVALIVTVIRPAGPAFSLVAFKLALHPESPHSIFYVPDGDERHSDSDDSDGSDDSSGEDGDSEEETSRPVPYRGRNQLKPGEKYRGTLQAGTLFVFGLCGQQKKG